MPTLFDPIGPPHSSQENRSNHSDISRWSMISNLNRRLNRIARSSSYPHSSTVSQEFLDWQTRQRPSQVTSSNNRPKKRDYSQQRTSRASDDWDASDNENPMNAPNDLVRQVNEIKQVVRFSLCCTFFQISSCIIIFIYFNYFILMKNTLHMFVNIIRSLVIR